MTQSQRIGIAHFGKTQREEHVSINIPPLCGGAKTLAASPSDDFGGKAFEVGDLDWINSLQWPAMAVTVMAAWLVASQLKLKRNWGFWLFCLAMCCGLPGDSMIERTR